MENIEIITLPYKVHTFYCDACNKFLGKSVEDDFGYYKKAPEGKGFIPLRFLDHQFFPRQGKYYCTVCYEKIKNEMIEKLDQVIQEL